MRKDTEEGLDWCRVSYLLRVLTTCPTVKTDVVGTQTEDKNKALALLRQMSLVDSDYVRTKLGAIVLKELAHDVSTDVCLKTLQNRRENYFGLDRKVGSGYTLTERDLRSIFVDLAIGCVQQHLSNVSLQAYDKLRKGSEHG